MPGLRFTTGLDVASAPQPRYGNAPSPSNATEAAFGVGSAPPSPRGGLHPGNTAGFAFWTGVGATVFLVLLYRSLPG
jgi:hypothetical protein